jgi:uncharacterized protein YydD (DUF2326 family)
MKLSKLYSSKDKIFGPINFNTGVDGHLSLNVVYAEVKNKKSSEKDSHNLGKTTLIHVIDFLLLADIDVKGFFLTSSEIFTDFEFYLEILLDSDTYLTIRRDAKDSRKISFKKHSRYNQDFTDLNEKQWDHWKVSLDKAREIMDSYCQFQTIEGFPYRKGLSYFIRTQQDYGDFFRISKFSPGKDKDWKPYVAKVLGLDDKILSEKYSLEEEITRVTAEKEGRASRVDFSEEEIEKLKLKISLEKDEIQNIRNKLDGFDFHEAEINLNQKLTDKIEEDISQISRKLYSVNFDIKKLNEYINENIEFDLDEIEQIYEEANIILPELLIKKYEELLAFNKAITTERKKGFKDRLKDLLKQKEVLERNHKRLSAERQNALVTVKTTDIFDKYKSLQKELEIRDADLINLSKQLEKLEEVADLSQEVRLLEGKKQSLIESIKKLNKQPNSTYEAITKDFNYLVQEVLNTQGYLYFRVNAQGNIDFKIDVESNEIKGNLTNKSKGTSYRKILCALFDLAILRHYSKQKFYHFVYHDGIFEALDNRIKRAFLKIVKESCSEYGIEYILSVIEDDLPRDENDQKIYFTDDEIILRLHDGGPSGRLFRMNEF